MAEGGKEPTLVGRLGGLFCGGRVHSGPAGAAALRGRALRRLGRCCDELLTSLDLPDGVDIVTLCQRLGERRRRPVRLVPFELNQPQLYGIWFATDEADYITYERRTSPLHQEHIIAHELAHIVRGHGGFVREGDPAAAAGLLPTVDAGVVRAMLPRSGYSDSDEREAEAMASLLLARLRRPPAESVWQATPTDAETLARIERVVGPDRPPAPPPGPPTPPACRAPH